MTFQNGGVTLYVQFEPYMMQSAMMTFMLTLMFIPGSCPVCP